MATFDYISIDDIKKEIAELGWQWIEHHFNDKKGLGDTSISLTLHTDTEALTDFSIQAERIGWGRFNYAFCWHSAYDYIVLGLRDNTMRPIWIGHYSAYRVSIEQNEKN